jgi:hypothetical protein
MSPGTAMFKRERPQQVGESERTWTIKDVQRRVAQLERRRYKEEKDALKREIKELKKKD